MKNQMLALALLLGCQGADDETYRSSSSDVSCRFTNEGQEMPDYDPDRDWTYRFNDSLAFPPAPGDDLEDVWAVLWEEKSAVYIATSEDTTYRKLTYVDKIGGPPYKKNWYMWLSPDDDTRLLSSYVYIVGEPHWDDDIEWFKLRTKMTDHGGGSCESRTRTIWVDY